MFIQSLVVTKIQLVSFVSFVMLCASFFILQTPFASAQVRSATTQSELQLQIKALIAQIAALNSSSTTVESEMVVGTQVETTSKLRVRGAANGSGIIKGIQNSGSKGVIVQGRVSQGGNIWVKVNFNSGVDGWVASPWLKIIPALDSHKCNSSGACPDIVLQDNVKPIVTELLGVANLNTLSAGAKGVSIDGSFEIKITAQDSSVYVNPNSIKIFPSVGEKSTMTDNPMITKSVSSDATKVGNYYMIEEGQSRVLKINFQYFPREIGTYTIVMQNFEYAVTPVGQTFTKELYPNRPETNEVGFFNKTPSQEIKVISKGAEAKKDLGQNDVGYFTVKFDVTAIDQNIYIKPMLQNRSQDNAGVKFTVDGTSLEGVKDGVTSAVLMSVAKKSSLGTYIVPEGETVGFTAVVTLKAGATGNYTVSFNGISYSNESSGTQHMKFAAFNPVSDFRTPNVKLISGVAQQPAKINALTADPINVPLNGKLNLGWNSTATKFCTLFDFVNGRQNLVQANLKSNGTIALFPYEKYVSGTSITYKLTCQDASTLKDNVVEATVLVKLEPSPAKATPRFNGMSGGATPTIVIDAIFGKPSTGIVAVTGPTKIGTVAWGDGVIESVNGLITGTEMSKSLTHTYKQSGKYYINITNVDGKKAILDVEVNVNVAVAPQKNNFNCDRSVSTKVASGSIACYGMWDYGEDFGGDVHMCGDYDGKTGCVISTPVCSSGAAKATKYIGSGSLSTANLPTISRQLGVSEAVAKAGIAGLWEYTCSAPVPATTSPRVLGATTNILSEISISLTAIKNILSDLQ